MTRRYSRMVEAAIGMARGTTADRPANPEIGDVFYNGTMGMMEIYTADGWSGDTQTNTSGIPFGGTSDRPTPATGQPFFNGDESRLELYTTSNGWQNIVQETPAITSISGTYLESAASSTIFINGTNFSVGAIAYAIGTDGTEFEATQTSLISVVELTATFSGLSKDLEPYDIKVVNPSNLYGILYDSLQIDDAAAWLTQSGSLGTFSENSPISIAVSATDEESNSITYSLSSGSLPPGLSLSSSGVISGTVSNISADTTYTFSINAASSSNNSYRSFSIAITDTGPSWVTSALLPTFTKNVAYSTTLEASDNDAIASYSLFAGSLPTGLSLNSSTGVISGTPTSDLNTIFTIRATDNGGKYVDRQFTLNNEPPAWISSSGPISEGFNANVPYTFSLAASDDSAVLSYTIISGNLPEGLSLNSSTGVISGTPTANVGSAFTVRISDANNNFVDREFSLHAKPTFVTTAGQITKTTQLQATAYDSQTIASYSVVSGTIHSGLSLSSSGLFSGQPTEVATKTFTVRVTDNLGFYADREFSIVTQSVPQTTTFEFTGSQQTFVTQSATTQFDVYGASSAWNNGGGRGGRSTGTLTNIPVGTTLYIYVGGQGTEGATAAGGFNGGGSATGNRGNEDSGGGASDIRLGGNALSNRIVVAGGGGGGGGYAGAQGGNGGGANQNGESGGSGQGGGGGGGTQTSGGSAGYSNGGSPATSGSFGVGGTGGFSWNAGGGGGGGGWYGGGGGGPDDNSCCSDGGGGGGGSGYVNMGYAINISGSTGVREGNGQILLSYNQIV